MSEQQQTKETTARLIIGYRTRPVEHLEELIPTFHAPRHWVDQAKIKANIAEQKEEFLAEAKDMPYTGTFDEVCIVDSLHRNPGRWSYAEGRHPGGTKPSVAVAVRNWLLRNYPNAWGYGLHEQRRPQAIFIGFDPRTFLKILGLECSLPRTGKPLPPRLWYGNSDHRDILEAVMPKDYKRLDLSIVLKERRPTNPEAQAKWDANLNGWTAPGIDPFKDTILATELAHQLGFLSD